MRFANFGVAVGALLLVAGCAQPLKKQAYNQAAAAHIQQVVVTRKPPPARLVESAGQGGPQSFPWGRWAR